MTIITGSPSRFGLLVGSSAARRAVGVTHNSKQVTTLIFFDAWIQDSLNSLSTVEPAPRSRIIGPGYLLPYISSNASLLNPRWGVPKKYIAHMDL